MEVEHVTSGERSGAFVIQKDGERLAEMTYSPAGDRISIDHTWVSESLRGHGVARRLLDAAVTWLRTTNTRVVARCPYAKKELERDPALRDLL
jgi:uncharacterized protein